MENRVDFPSRGDVEAEWSSRDDFFNFERTGALHLEFLGSSHMKVCRFQPYLVSNFPRGEFGCNLLLHLLLSHFVGGLSIIASGGQV